MYYLKQIDKRLTRFSFCQFLTSASR